MADLIHKHANDSSRTVTVGATPQAKLDLSFAQPAGVAFEVIASCLVDTVDAAAVLMVELMDVDGGTALASSEIKPDVSMAQGGIRPWSAEVILAPRAADVTRNLRLRFYLQAAGTAVWGCRGAHLRVLSFQPSDLTADSPGAVQNTTVAGGTPVYVRKPGAELTLSPGEWLVTCAAEIGALAGSVPGVAIRASWGSPPTVFGENLPVRSHGLGTAGHVPWLTHKRIVALGGELVGIDFRAQAGRTAECRRAVVIARKIVDLPDFAWAEAASGTAPGTAVVDALPMVFTGGGVNDVILTHATIWGEVTTTGAEGVASFRLLADGVVDGPGEDVPIDASLSTSANWQWSRTTNRLDAVSTAQHAYGMRLFCSAAGLTAFFKDAGLYAIQTTGGGTQAPQTADWSEGLGLGDGMSLVQGALPPPPPPPTPPPPPPVPSGVRGTWRDSGSNIRRWVDAASRERFWGYAGVTDPPPPPPPPPPIVIEDPGPGPGGWEETVVVLGDAFGIVLAGPADTGVGGGAGGGWASSVALASSFEVAVTPPLVEGRAATAAWIAQTRLDVGAAPIIFYEADFGPVAGVFRAWNGTYARVWNGVTWYGAAEVLEVSSQRESADRSRNGITVTLPLHDAGSVRDHVAEARNATINGDAYLWLGYLEDDGDTVQDPVCVFHGKVASMPITTRDDGLTQIAVDVEHEDRDLDRGQRYRMTHATQVGIDRTDLFFSRLAKIADVNLEPGHRFYARVHEP